MPPIKEADWESCKQPWTIFNYLRPRRPDKRKLRLFACACIRRHWARLVARSQRAVENVERLADGLLGLAEFQAARDEAVAAAQQAEQRFRNVRESMAAIWAAHGAWSAALAICQATGDRALNGAVAASSHMRAAALAFARTSGPSSADTERMIGTEEAAVQAAVLRDLFRPFRSPPFDPAWLAWNDGCLRKMAQAIYDDRAFDRLPLLADALEDAGCTDAAILNHCRQSGPHVRGCWLVDLLLGKS